MKNSILLLAAIAAATGLNAQPASQQGGQAASPTMTPTSSYSVTADFTYASEYIFRGVENSSSAFQPSVEVTIDDFNVGLWTNQPITKSENNEIDLYAGYKFRLSSGLSLEAVTTYYWYPEAKASLGQTKDTFEVGGGVTWQWAGFYPNVYYYHDFTLEADTIQAAVGYSLPLEGSGLSIDTSVYFGHVKADDASPDAAGPKVGESYTYYGVDVTIPYKLTSAATLSVAAHYANVENLGAVGGPFGTLSDQNIWFTVGLSVGF